MSFLTQAMKRCRRECAADDPLACVDGDEVLSHYGRADAEPPFRNKPRSDREPGLSLHIGERTAEEMCRLVLGEPSVSNLQNARVRWTTARALREAGFAVIHTPGKLKFQKTHVTAAWPGDDGVPELAVDWSNAVTARFDSCFNAS